MHQERYYTIVGIFVVGALALMVFASLFFYNEYLEAKKDTYVMFFEGSLAGLKTSAKVTYRGVTIGEVKLIEIVENKTNTDVRVVVYVDFYKSRSFGKRHNAVPILLNKGFVATVGETNLLTGEARIQLLPSDDHQVFKQKYYHKYPIFPTQRKPKSISAAEVLETAKKTLKDISDFLQSKEVRSTLQATREMTDSMQKLMDKLDENAPQVIAYLTQSFSQFSKAAFSAQNLADYLLRHPESLLRGRS